ncbi:glutathione S-transferase-like protein [Rhizobium azibense]|nr:glutathione S-transferase-like protein [Rhizobium azibense]
MRYLPTSSPWKHELRSNLERVDIRKTPHLSEAGVDFVTINPNLYAPVLELDDGSVLTEGVAIIQFLADLKPDAGLVPVLGSPERYRFQAWLNFIATELHRIYSPWLFSP